MSTRADHPFDEKLLQHGFVVADAERFGVPLAIVIHHHRLWILRNKANHRNFHDGRTWTYNSLPGLSDMLPYFSKYQIERLMKKLVELGVLIKGNYNTRKGDRTLWYAFADEAYFLGTSTNRDSAGLPRESAGPSRDSAGPSRESAGPLPSISTQVSTQVGTQQKSQLSPEAKAMLVQSGKARERTLERIMEKYREVMAVEGDPPRAWRLTPKLRKLITDRLETFSEADLIQAAVNLSKDAWHRGENKQGKEWVHPTLLYRNDDQVDKWMNEKKGKKVRGRGTFVPATENRNLPLPKVIAVGGSKKEKL